jgi:hypothetical protein
MIRFAAYPARLRLEPVSHLQNREKQPQRQKEAKQNAKGMLPFDVSANS